MSHKAEFVFVRHFPIMTTREKVRDFVLFAGLKNDMFVPFYVKIAMIVPFQL